MVSLKFAAVICLVYLTIFVNAGKKKPTCKTVLAKLDEMGSLCQGKFRNVSYFTDIEWFKFVAFGHCKSLNSFNVHVLFMIRCRI